ncbi:S24/S26 family peptidase [Parabacteroides sp. APC149_11_2_Y6]
MKRICVSNDVLLGEVAYLLKAGGSVTFRVKGNSMRPLLHGEKDKVILIPPVAVKQGDLVLARLHAGNYVLHRIIQIQGDRLTLMGDGNLIGKEYCNMDNLVGKVEAVIKKDKTIYCSDWKWKTTSFLWVKLLPIRRYLLKIIR